MGHQEIGTDSYPVSFLVPDDGDAKNAASINVALVALADRTERLRLHSPRLQRTAFTTTSTFVVPDRVTQIAGTGYGGGGTGGRGGVPGTGTGKAGGGGSGGGGSIQSTVVIDVTPGETLDVIIGAGGTGLDANNNGNPGGDTKIQRAGIDIAVFAGAGGGIAGDNTAISSSYPFAAPGLPVRPGAGGTGIVDYAFTGGRTVLSSNELITLAMLLPRPAGAGGSGIGNSSNTQGGMRNAVGTGYGGAGGTTGATVASFLGGGGGGGGGAGPAGNGGAGGNGPPGFNGAGNTGAFGATADANSGAGGGGGSGAGGCASSPSTGGIGGGGGGGKVIITYALESP